MILSRHEVEVHPKKTVLTVLKESSLPELFPSRRVSGHLTDSCPESLEATTITYDHSSDTQSKGILPEIAQKLKHLGNKSFVLRNLQELTHPTKVNQTALPSITPTKSSTSCKTSPEFFDFSANTASAKTLVFPFSSEALPHSESEATMAWNPYNETSLNAGEKLLSLSEALQDNDLSAECRSFKTPATELHQLNQLSITIRNQPESDNPVLLQVSPRAKKVSPLNRSRAAALLLYDKNISSESSATSPFAPPLSPLTRYRSPCDLNLPERKKLIKAAFQLIEERNTCKISPIE